MSLTVASEELVDKSTILENFYAQKGQTITGPRGREVTVTEGMLNQQLQGELIAAQNFDYVPYGSIDPDDYETDEFGNVIVRVDPVFGPQAASGDALGFSFSDKEAANQLFGGQADQVESAVRNINSDIYAITSGAAELGLTLPEEDQQRLRQEAQELYPDASEAELQYVFKELVKDELGVDDFQAEKVRLSEQRNDLLAQAGLDVATMGERAGPQQTLAGTYEVDVGETTFTVDADTGDITTYTKPTTGTYAKGLLTAAATAGLGTAITPAIVGALGSTAGTAVGAGLSSAAGQLVTTGKVDPAATLASAVTAGINPGGMLAENFGVATGTGVNIVPTNVVGGFVQGATNELVSSAITEGKLDLESALVSGLIDAGVKAASDFLSDASKDSIESEMQRIKDDRDVKGLPELTTEELYAAALTNASVGKSDLGGLVGEGGLLPFIDPVNTEAVNKLLGGGEFSPLEVFIGPDGKEYTDLEILAGAAGEGVSPADIYYGNVPGWSSGIITYENTILGDAFDFAKENIPGVSQAANVVGGILDALGTQQFKNTYGATPEEFLAAKVSIDEIQRMISYGSLEETYNFAVNPRGDSQMVGTLSGIPGLYTTGANNPFLVYGPDPTGADSLQDAINITNIQDQAAATAQAAAEAANSAVIVNLSGTETAVSANTVLPGTNITIGDAVLGGFIDGVLINNNNNTATVSSGGETVTTTAAGTGTTTAAGTGSTTATTTGGVDTTTTDSGVGTTTDSGTGTTTTTGGVDTTTTGGVGTTTTTGGVGTTTTTGGVGTTETVVSSQTAGPTTQEIKELYQEHLGRDPLQSGIDAWQATGQSLDQVAAGISQSPEANVYNSYQENLGRDPDMDERQYWVNLINTTGSIDQAVNAIATSEEAQNFQTENLDIFVDTTTGDTTLDTTDTTTTGDTTLDTTDTTTTGDTTLDTTDTTTTGDTTLDTTDTTTTGDTTLDTTDTTTTGDTTLDTTDTTTTGDTTLDTTDTTTTGDTTLDTTDTTTTGDTTLDTTDTTTTGDTTLDTTTTPTTVLPETVVPPTTVLPPAPPPSTTSSGGGGGGGGMLGGSTGTAQPFLRGLSYTPTVPLALQRQAPVDFAAGLMRPENSMDILGQLISRNLA